ncbi:phosphatidylserine decarboxylase-domain-containing protein [Parasitella parasitica]|nr:phosphatidylserine decarboxylase-domain-containing protein [Parasitella parasitica]
MSTNQAETDKLSADLILKVDIIRGRNLNREDEANIPNPYVNVRFGSIRQRTDTIKKSSDPEWLCSFEFNLSNDIIGHKKRLKALKKQGLSITAFSKDRFSSIFLGQASWPLDEMFSRPDQFAFDDATAKWYPLSRTSRQHRRFHLRKKRGDTTSTNTSDADQAEICCQFGLLYKTGSGTVIPTDSSTFAEDWQFLLDEEEDDTDINALSSSPPPASTASAMPEMQKSSSTASFSSRFKRPLKQDNSTSSINSLSPSIEKLQQQQQQQQQLQKPKRTRRLKNKFRRRGRRGSRRNKKKNSEGGYAKFYSDVMGITFLEIENAKDLPPERNVTRTGFDMDPFVIVSYGTSTFRTRAIRHNLNPTWNEKLFFHVRNTQENYKIKFAVYDKDKFSGNDFVASQEISIADIIQKMPTTLATPTALEQGDGNATTPSQEIERNMGRHSIPLRLAKPDKWKDSCHPTLTIRAKFVPYVQIRKMFWIALAKTCDADNSNTMSRLEVQAMLEALGSNISESTIDHFWEEHGKDFEQDLTMDELVASLESFILAVDTKQDGYDPNAIIEQEKDVPVDAKNNNTVNPFFLAASDDEDDDGDDDDEEEDEYDLIDDDDELDDYYSEGGYFSSHGEYDEDDVDLAHSGSTTTAPQSPDEADYEALAEAEGIQYIDGPLKELKLQQDKDLDNQRTHKMAQEKVIRLNECPICHKPNLSKRGQMDIVTHVATCTANDWTTVDRFLMGNFGSEAQAQRKWFVKLVNKVGYGRYSAGKNNANIIVQDRLTGQLIDERMSVYVRLGMRLVYKGMRSGIQSKTAKRILANMSIKQGRRFDNPLSKREINSFIKFHQLDMSEVLEPMENFNTFNEFFYRKLKPGSRPCEAPDNKRVAVSPADCRMMAFPTIDSATNIWIKGVEFSISKLLDDAEEAKAYEGGALAIFRLAPQDYHRYHSPVDGVIRKIHSVQGQYYTVNPMAIRTTLDVYGDNKRDIVHMETEAFGKVAIVCIGAMMVGSIILTAGVGDHLARTDELGYFAFGGSTLVVLFEKNAMRFDEDLLENASNSLETLVRVGNHIGVHP